MKKKWIRDAIHNGIKTKTWKIMRLSALFIFLFLSQVWAGTGYSQQTKLTLKMNNVRVLDVLDQIEEKSEFYFLFNQKLVDVERKVDVDVREKTIGNILNEVFSGTDVHHQVKDRLIVLTTEKNDFSMETVIQQQNTVSGTVTDDTGQPLPGVTIVIKGTTQGTVTNVDGIYFLTDIPKDATLVFSFVGMLTKEVIVGSQTNINVTMEQDVIGIEEVVAIGYGTQKKSDLTGSVQRANIGMFEDSPNTNILQSLSGSAPGLSIGKTYTTGSEPSMQIRGQNTLSGSTSPLIVLDGMIYRGSVGDINPSDVESVDILKDASSKAVYGAQAANGVIIITTKTGKRQKPMFNISTYYSYQTPANSLRTLNREEFIQAAKDFVWQEAYLAPDYLTENHDFVLTDNVAWQSNILDGYNNGVDYDWVGNCTSPGRVYNTDFSVTGGAEDFTYMISFNYNKQEGWVMNDNYNRKSGRINLKYDITKWLTIGTNSFLSFSDFSGDTPDFSTVARMNPLVTPYVGNAESGEYDPYPNGTYLNPFMNSATVEKNNRNQLMTKAYAVIKVPKIKDLTYTANYSYDYKWQPRVYSNEYMAGLTGNAYGSYSNNTGYIFDNIINYTGQFGDHKISATLLAGIEKRDSYSFTANGTSFTDMTLVYYALETAANQTISSSGWQEQYAYQMARGNYNYKNKYFLTGTIRRDGFSGFAKNKKSAYFPSAGLAWVPSEENFWNDNILFNYAKLRASYGVNGNTVSRYSSIARVSRSNQYVFDGQSVLGQYISSLANNDLSWEKTNSYNFGVDLGFFNNKVMTNIDYYTSKTTDLIWNLSLPQLTGFSSITSNVGEIENKGIEMSLHANNILNAANFKWSFDLFFDSNRNKINKLIGLDSDGDGKEDDLIASGLFIGEAIHSLYDYEVDGIWQISEMDDVPSDSEVGMYKYKDLDGDGDLTPEKDRRVLGRQEPAYSFGVQNTFSYKNLSFSFFIKSIQGGKNGYMKLNEPDHRGGEVLTYMSWYADIDYWTPSNPGATYRRQGGDPREYGGGTYQQRNFIRLQDISLAYDFNKQIIKKIGVDNLKVYLTGKDLITITKWLGWDPETGQGVAMGGYPVMRSVTLGLDIKF